MPEHHDSADTIARWLEEHTGREVRFEKVEPGDERARRSSEGRARNGTHYWPSL